MRARTSIACAVGLLLLAGTTGVDAQLGGLIKKKAAEMAKPKPAEPKPAPTETKPATETAPPSAPASEAPATAPAAAAPAATAAAAAPAPKPAADPLDESNLNLDRNINHIVRAPANESRGRIPFFSPATVAAMKLLDNNSRVALVEKTGPAIKAMVMSETFAKAHAEYIRTTFNAVDHGIVVKDMETMVKAGDMAGTEAFGKRQQALALVSQMETQSAADIQRTLGVFLPMWKQTAQQATGARKAKYERMVKDGEALAAAGTGDVTKLRRGMAVLMSIDNDGPATEQALYGLADQAKKETQQLAWNQQNLNAVVKSQLTSFVATCGSVDFSAKTEMRNNTQKFVNPAYEKKDELWKACYRAGQPATNAARQFAQAWLKELK